MSTLVRRIALPAVLVAGLGVSTYALDRVAEPVLPADAQAPMAIAGASDLAQAFRTASRSALQGVVHVQVEGAARNAQTARGGIPRQGSGSGFIISPDGYVMTNNHVVENATRVTVTLTDRRQFDATVVGRDPNTDVAVLRVEGRDLPTVRMGDSGALEVGYWVLALGYPLSLGETVTAGIVSAKGKSLGMMQANEEAQAPLEHFIQTDAAINPGNSGGPLVNLAGEVIGMNTAIASPTGTYSGYGFAVPITIARRAADDLIRYGAVRRPRLAVEIKDVEPVDVEVYGLSDANGAVVVRLQDGPARDAGVQLGDVIVAVDGVGIRDNGDLMERIALRQPGDRVTLDLVRFGRRAQATVTLGAFESAATARAAATAPARRADGELGFAAAELTGALAARMGIPAAGGIVVTQVDPAGAAPRRLTGLRIQTINGREIGSLDELRRVAATLRAGDAVSVVGIDPAGDRTILNYRIR